MEKQPSDFISFHFPQFTFLLLFLNDYLEQNSFTQDISQESCQVYRITNCSSPNNNRETINCFYTSKTQNQRIRNTPRSSDKIHKPSKGILLVTSCYAFIKSYEMQKTLPASRLFSDPNRPLLKCIRFPRSETVLWNRNTQQHTSSMLALITSLKQSDKPFLASPSREGKQ